jgi:para-aminobenzoate synthetase component 1
MALAPHYFSDSAYLQLRTRLLAWAGAHPQCAVLDSCGYQDPGGLGAWRLLVGVRGDTRWQAAPPPPGSWYFGGLGYAWKNSLEQLASTTQPGIPFPDQAFFEADTVLGIPRQGNQLICLHGSMPPLDPYEEVIDQPQSVLLALATQMDRAAYGRAFRQVQQWLWAGELYEMNLCRELTATALGLDTLGLWQRLLQLSPVPMAAYLRLGAWCLMSASPERYLLHRNGLLLSEPIKGTVRRAGQEAAEHRLLTTDPKLRAENTMIADLVRNDLSRVCVPGTVQAQLCQPLTLSTLHHLVSRVYGVLQQAASPWQALEASFPPGSMTGAPKVAAMQAIDRLEPVGRGLYSGAVGYTDPAGNYDFAVVIRSFIYHSPTGRLSTHVGGALTVDSDCEAEWAETETKALALRQGSLFSSTH